VLSDATERNSYDYILDRQRRGLPTDPRLIFEAESLFHKAQTLVRRGQAGAAEPILRQVVGLNPGEPEFWAYLGFAVFSAQGKEGRAEAIDHLNKALAMNERLGVAYEFIGRMARIDGKIREAEEYLKKALKLEPKNVEVQRELRLLTMRASSGGNGKSEGLGGLLNKVLKR
jgi:tetratricopeptide (TPR) repeat protein